MIVKRLDVHLGYTIFLLLPVHVIPTMRHHLRGGVRVCVLGCLVLHAPGDHADLLGGVSSKSEYSSRQNTANGQRKARCASRTYNGAGVVFHLFCCCATPTSAADTQETVIMAMPESRVFSANGDELPGHPQTVSTPCFASVASKETPIYTNPAKVARRQTNAAAVLRWLCVPQDGNECGRESRRLLYLSATSRSPK